MKDMMKEFDAEVKGIGVLVETVTPAEKKVEDYIPLLILEEVVEETGEVTIHPNPELFSI
jgi:purine operon repressor